MLWRLTWQLTLLGLVLVAVLFWPAGTLDWWGGWAFIAQIEIASILTCIWLYFRDPALLEQRLSGGFEKTQLFWDKVLMAILQIGFFAWMILMAFDRRWGFSHMPRSWNYAGFAISSLFFVMNILVFRANSFAAPVVKIQDERNQKVATTGPYRFVRHPMYAGGLFYFIGIPLMLGSWIGFAIVPLFIAFIMLRIGLEERVLRQDLDGYDAYAARVRYRLVPGIW